MPGVPCQQQTLADMSQKPAYIKPIHTLVASSTRVPEQIKGRLVFVHTEKLRSGSEKAIAVMVDKHMEFALKSVLVHEAWSPADQGRLRKSLNPLVGKVVSITNAKIVPRHKSCVFFDASIKSAFDQDTVVAECPDDGSYPTKLPVLPNLQAASSLLHASYVSLVAAVTREGSALPCNVTPTVQKWVANLKMATDGTNMAAAFWDGHAAKMGSAKAGQVYRLDWVLLKQDADGNYSLMTVSASSVDLEEGELATAVQDSLADSSQMINMSSQSLRKNGGQTYADKMKKPFVQADLLSLGEIQSLQMITPRVLLVPACYLLEARGMTANSPNRAWYNGCTQCQKQLESARGETGNQGNPRLHRMADKCKEWRRMRQQLECTECPQHGENKGKKIYAGQVILADSSHKKELAVWDDMLRRLIKDFLGHEDLDRANLMEELCQAMKGVELVVRVGVAPRKDGTSVSLDLFDVAEQVNSEGCLAIYKTIAHDFWQGLPAIAPACCRNVSVNELGQLILKAGDAERLVDTVKLMVRVVEQEDLKVMDGIDGLEVSLKCECVCCKEQCSLYAAGMPATVKVYTRIAAGEYLMAFVHMAEPDHKFPVGYHVSLKGKTDVEVDARVFKWQAAQVIGSISNSSMPMDTDEKALKLKRTKWMESLLTNPCGRPKSKRLRLARTNDGSAI